MTDFLRVLLAASLPGSALFLALKLLRPAVERVFSARWQRGMLAVALVFYLVPLGLLARPLFPQTFLAGVRVLTDAGSAVQTAAAGWAGMQAAAPEEPPPATGLPEPEPLPPRTKTTQSVWPSVACGLWAVGVGCFLLRALYSHARFHRVLAAACVPADSARMLTLGAVMREMGRPGHVALLTSAAVCGPFSMGLARPRIVLPEDAPDGERLRLVLLHELTHIRTGDLPLKSLSLLANAAHWFNPLCWSLRRALDEACELTCDEAVALRLSARERRVYGETILDALGRGADVPSGYPALSADGKTMKRRLRHMLYVQTGSTRRRALSLLCALVLCAFTWAGAGAVHAAASPAPDVQDVTRNTVRDLAEQMQDLGVKMNRLAQDFPQNPQTEAEWERLSAKQEQMELYQEEMDALHKQIRAHTGAGDAASSKADTNAFLPHQEAKARSIEPYRAFGIDYDAQRDCVTYQGEAVRILADRKPSVSDNPLSQSWFFSSDSNFRDGHCLMATRDTSGVLTGVRTMAQDEVDSLFGPGFSAQAPQTNKKKPDRGQVTRTESMRAGCKPYEPLGMRYDAEEDQLYYGGEPLRLFVDFSAKELDGGLAFRMCVASRLPGAALRMRAVRDENDRLLRVEEIPPDELTELDEILELEESEEAPPQAKGESFSDSISGVGYFTFFATTNLADGAGSVTDRVSASARLRSGLSVSDWANGLDQAEDKAVVHVYEEWSDSKVQITLYYPGGGQYPFNAWLLDDGTLRVELSPSRRIEDSGKEGRQFLRASLDAERYRSGAVELYVDGVLQPVKVDA